jgi:hypothetical protein
MLSATTGITAHLFAGALPLLLLLLLLLLLCRAIAPLTPPTLLATDTLAGLLSLLL